MLFVSKKGDLVVVVTSSVVVVMKSFAVDAEVKGVDDVAGANVVVVAAEVNISAVLFTTRFNIFDGPVSETS